jgi:HlyD family secretion protein
MVRLEDDEYQAQVQQAKGQVANLQAKLDEALHGSRPEEIAQASANLEVAKSDLENAKVTLERTRRLLAEQVISRQSLDDAQARHDSAVYRVNALQKAFELVKIGPRKEQIDALRGQLEQAKGAEAYAETALANTVIRAPVTGTILERIVEKGEFVTTGFVGENGAKGYVVSLADLNDLEVELDISQADFARLNAGQHGTVTTDAFPDRKYDGFIKEISPEANRLKATVQIKVKVAKPDSYLRPEMNASVAFVLMDGKAVRRAVKTGSTSAPGVRVEEGLIGGEDLILNPPAGLKDGEKVHPKA